MRGSAKKWDFNHLVDDSKTSGIPKKPPTVLEISLLINLLHLHTTDFAVKYVKYTHYKVCYIYYFIYSIL